MANDTKISMHLIDEIKRLSGDELDCYKRGLTEHALMIQKERHRLEIALESFKARDNSAHLPM